MNNHVEPLISVIIPCYNHEKYIQESIQSVINQSYENIELIVIDDGSKDQSVKKIEEMRFKCEQRFQNFQFISRENWGLSKTLNQGLNLAKGDYFSTVASDDIMLPEKSTIQLSVFKQDPSITAVFGAHQYIDDASKVISVKKAKYCEFKFKDIFHHQFDIPASSQMINLKSLKEIGGYNVNTKVEDWDLWLRLTANGQKMVYVPDVIVGYRMHDQNFSKNKDSMFTEVYKILQNYKGLKGYQYAEYKVFKFYKIRPAREKSYWLYLSLRLKYSLIYLFKLALNKH